MPQDSPLSITASVTGILTFVVAVALGFYARALSLREALRVDYRIIEAVAQYSQNMNSAVLLGKFVEESLKQSRSQDHDDTLNLRKTFVEMFALELTSSIRLLLLLKSSRIQRLAEWENTRRGVLQRSSEAAALKSRITYIQTMMLSRNMDRKVDALLHGLKRVEDRFMEELDRVQSRLINPALLSRPRSPKQKYENQQLMSSLPPGMAEDSIAEEQPKPMDITTHSSMNIPSVGPKQDVDDQKPEFSSVAMVPETPVAEKPISPSIGPTHVSPEQYNGKEQPASFSVGIAAGSEAKEQPKQPLTKPSLHSTAGPPLTHPKQSSVSTVTALSPMSLVSAALPPSPNDLRSMYSEAYCLAKERFFPEVGEFDILLRSMSQPLFEQAIQRDPDDTVTMLIKLSQSIIHEALDRMQKNPWKTYWGFRGQQRVLNCFC